MLNFQPTFLFSWLSAASAVFGGLLSCLALFLCIAANMSDGRQQQNHLLIGTKDEVIHVEERYLNQKC